MEPERDAQVERSELMFNPWLTSSHRLVKGLVGIILFGYEIKIAPYRQRRIKARDQKNLETILGAVVANLALATVTGIEPPSFGVSLRKSKQKLSRYDRPGFTGLSKVLRTLSSVPDMFKIDTSNRKGIASVVTAGPILVENLRAEHLNHVRFGPEHFVQAEGRETIHLAKTERDFIANTVARDPIDYRDTQETIRYRAEMENINAFLAKADIRMEVDAGPLVITSLRHLNRCFNLPPESEEGVERFDHGGRLFGGWWQNLGKDRRHSIRINGEPVADLDYSSCFLRLAYLQAGLKPPEGDLYAAVPGLSDPRWRDGVKKVTSTMLFRTSPLTRLPRDLKGELPPGVSGAQVRSAILSAHPALKDVFETGIGLRLMFVESQVLVAALLRLVDKGIPALPMHDGLMVARSKANAAAKAMLEASEQVTGFRLPITLKSQYE